MNKNLSKRSTGSKTSLLKSKSVSRRSPSKKSGSKSKSSSRPNRSSSKSNNNKRQLTLHGKPLIRPLQRAMHISAHGTIPLFKDPQRNFKNILSKKVPKNVHLWFYSTIGCKLANVNEDPYAMMTCEIMNYGVKNKLSAKFKYGSLLGQGETYVDTLLSLSPLHPKNIIDLGVYSIQIPDVGNGNNNNGTPIAVDTLPMTKLKKSGQVWLSTILNSPMVTSNAAKGPVLIVVDACRDINSPGAVKNANGVINRKNTIHKPLNQKTFFSRSQYPPSVIHNMQTYLITMLNNEVVQTGAYMKKHGYYF
tara:strand:+ start:174 stop:1091 length:918 start_codon:yes stop_codon:yes gene_type:complete